MRKTLFIAFCVIAMLFTFTACPEEDVLDNENNYADNDFAADLADSIYAEGAAESLVAAASQQGNDVNGLTITYAFADEKPEITTTPTPTSIKVDVTVSGEYNDGFHQDTHAYRSLTEGAGTVIVNGDISLVDDVLTFDAKTYTASTTKDVVIKDTDGDYKGEHTFRVTKIEGTAEGKIQASSNGFTTTDISLTLPAADKVEVYLDGKPVDYSKLCSTVGVEPGEYKITFIPGNNQ